MKVPSRSGSAGTRFRVTSFVAIAAGMIRGKFSGLQKNSNTHGSGKETHCSNSRCSDMPLWSCTREIPRSFSLPIADNFAQQTATPREDVKKNRSERIAKEPVS